MLAKAPVAVLPDLEPSRYRAHPLHAGERDWPETNCYVDVWVEVLHALGADPTAALGFTVAQDFEGDHFTFAKMPLEDLFELYGLTVQELALYDTLESHLVEQTRRGRMVLVEVDGFHLPDTRGTSYRTEHTKTSVAVNRIDPARRELDYFHNAGFHALAGEDYDRLLRIGDAPEDEAAATALFPYAEFIKLDGLKPCEPATALVILCRHLVRRPAENPVAAFRARVRDQAEEAAARPNAFLHRYAFNTARQLGMNFELLGTHLAWLHERGASWMRLQTSIDACKALSTGAKAFQFQLARAVARRRFDALEQSLDPLVDHYSRIFDGLAGL